MSKPLNLVIGNAKISYRIEQERIKVAEAKNNQTPDVSEQDKSDAASWLTFRQQAMTRF